MKVKLKQSEIPFCTLRYTTVSQTVGKKKVSHTSSKLAKNWKHQINKKITLLKGAKSCQSNRRGTRNLEGTGKGELIPMMWF